MRHAAESAVTTQVQPYVDLTALGTGDQRPQDRVAPRGLVVCPENSQFFRPTAPGAVRANLPGRPRDNLQNYPPDVWKRDRMAEQQAKLRAHHAAFVPAIIR
jgi:hypothetical protein